MDEQEQDQQPRRKRAPRPRRFEPARRIRLPIGVGAKIDELAIQGHRSPEDQLRYLIALGLEQATKAE